MRKIVNILFLFLTFSCSAKNESVTLAVVAEPIEGGTINGQGIYDINTTATVRAEPNPGYLFEKWVNTESSEVLSLNREYSFTIKESKSLSACFVERQKEILIAEQESQKLSIIVDYGNDIPQDSLLVLTRYIGDLFIDQGISLNQSGVSCQLGEVDMVISTEDLEKRQMYNAITGGGPHIWIAKSFSSSIYPWAKPDNNLVFQMYAAVPIVNLTDPKGNTAHSGFSANQAPVTQLSFGFYLLDETTRKTFAYIICAYDSRGTYKETAKSNDTFVNFASSPIEESSLYISKVPLSVSLQSKPYSDKKIFKVQISAKNLMKAIRDANHGMSEDLTKYRLTFAGVLFELPNYVLNGHNTSRVNVSKFSVFIE